MSNIPKGCKPFNLEEALAGKPVVTRNGRQVKIAGHNPEAVGISLKIIGWIDNVHYGWTENARCLYPNPDANKDLFMKTEKKDVWVVLYGIDNSIFSQVLDTMNQAQALNEMLPSLYKRLGIHKITVNL